MACIAMGRVRGIVVKPLLRDGHRALLVENVLQRVEPRLISAF